MNKGCAVLGEGHVGKEGTLHKWRSYTVGRQKVGSRRSCLLEWRLPVACLDCDRLSWQLRARTAALRSVADAWQTRFGVGGDAASRASKSSRAAFLGASLTGCAWQLSGGNILAPLTANFLALLEYYAFSLDEDAATAKVLLPSECDGH